MYPRDHSPLSPGQPRHVRDAGPPLPGAARPRAVRPRPPVQRQQLLARVQTRIKVRNLNVVQILSMD